MLQRVPAKFWLRLLVPLALLGALALVLRFTSLSELIHQDRLIGWLESARANPLAPLALVGLYVVVGLSGAPITPVVLAGGAVFGLWMGAALNFVGIFTGASATYFVARLLGYELVSRLLGRRHRRLERFLGRRGFWALVRLRYIPLPFFVVNFGAAVAGVRYPLFAATTAIAFAPWMLLWSYFASTLVQVGSAERAKVIRDLVVFALMMVAISFVPTQIAARRRKKRYLRLKEERRRRR